MIRTDFKKKPAWLTLAILKRHNLFWYRITCGTRTIKSYMDLDGQQPDSVIVIKNIKYNVIGAYKIKPWRRIDICVKK